MYKQSEVNKALITILLILSAIIVFTSSYIGVVLIALAINFVIGTLFYSMTIEVNGNKVGWYFGLGFLRKEVEVLTSRLRPAGTGILHTAIDVIKKRIDELIEEVTAPYWKDEDGDIGRLPGQTKASHLRSIEGALEEDVYDGFAEHTEAMEQSRLRRIQDSAAGRKPNEVRDAYLWSANKEGHWSPDEPIDRKAVTQEEMSRFYNDGPHIGARENDDGTWDMSAAARMETKPNRVRDAYLHSSKQKDDAEHTEEYYDTERNRPVEALL